VRIKSRDPMAAPAIQLNFLDNDTDRRAAIAGIKGMRRVCSAPAFRPFAVEEFKPGPSLDTDEQIAAGASAITSTIFHPTSTCRMGADDRAVVDDRLRVKGVSGLRVVDASVMPVIVSGNTNAATIMIAEKASDMIRQDRRTAG